MVSDCGDGNVNNGGMNWANLSLIVFNFVLKHRMLLQISKVHYYIDHIYSLGTFPGKGWYWSQLLAFGYIHEVINL